MPYLREVLIFGILAMAMVLRYWGLSWGVPERIDFHPDEIDYVMKHALLVREQLAAVLRGDAPFTRATLDPVFLNYPAFLMYMTAGLSGLLQKLDLVSGTMPDAYLVGRAISATFGATTCVLVFFIAEELGASLAGAALSALWMALMPLHVWESHVAVTDVTMTFWVAATLWASLRLLRTSRWRDYALAGAALGLAVGSKYTAAIAAVAIVVAACWTEKPAGYKLRGLALAGLISIGACFLVTPYSFLRFPDLWAAMQYEHQHTIGHHIGFSLPAAGPQYHKYVYQLTAAWPFSLGLALYACATIGTIWILFRADRRHVVLLSFALVYFGVTGHWTFTPLRYYLPVLVVGVIFAGVWQGEWLELAPRSWRISVAALVVLTLGYTAVFTWQTTDRYRHDTRIEAGQWMADHAPPGGQVLNCGWNRYMGMVAGRRAAAMRKGDERSFWTLDRNAPFDLIQISSLHYNRHYRHDNKPYEIAYDRLRDPNGEFHLVQRFESHFVNKRLYAALDPMFEGYFLSPTIELYEPKNRRKHAQN